MHVVINNKIRICNYTNKVWDWAYNNLVIKNPTYETLMRLGKEDTIRRKRIPEKLTCFVIKGNDLEIPFGCLYGIWDLIKDCQKDLIFNDNGFNAFHGVELPSGFELFDYQEEAVREMMKARGGVLVAPCSAGKTFMGIDLLRRIGRKFLWLTHTKDLLNQSLKEMKNLYPFLDIGTITEGKVNIGKDGTISTVQTLSMIDLEIYKKEFDVVIVDECAHCAGTPTISKMFQKVVENIPARYKFGLTATPSRSDTMIDTMYMILGMSPRGCFEGTHIIPTSKVRKIVAEHQRIDLETDFPYDCNVFDIDGTIIFNELINYLSENDERNDAIIKNVLKCNNEGRKQVILCHRVEHCKTFYNKLRELGINAEIVIGSTSDKKRKELLKEDNTWNVLVATYSLLKEGISIKALDTLHFSTPIHDKAMVVQCVGRIERFLEGKKQPIVYDYVDINNSYCTKRFYERKRYIKNRL